MSPIPFLLQAFAARLLASKQEETVSRDSLAKQGYDVEMLVEMIQEANAMSDSAQAFVVSADEVNIRVARKWKNTAPQAPAISAPQQPPITGAPAVVAPPAIVSLAGLVKRAELAKSAANAKR